MGRAYFLAALIWALASAAAADCLVEYKAKRDDPLRLDYGMVAVSGDDCTAEGVREAVRALLEERGWILLNVLSASRDGHRQNS